MPSKGKTSVVLTKKAKAIKDENALAFGLKFTLSAALEVFGELSEHERIERVSRSRRGDAEGVVHEAEEIAKGRIESRRRKSSESRQSSK
jgi:hypothetical protein